MSLNDVIRAGVFSLDAEALSSRSSKLRASPVRDSLLTGLLDISVQFRLGCNSNHRVISHPWLSEFDTNTLLAPGYSPRFVPNVIKINSV